jgi:hypothetical protein
LSYWNDRSDKETAATTENKFCVITPYGAAVIVVKQLVCTDPAYLVMNGGGVAHVYHRLEPHEVLIWPWIALKLQVRI